MNEVDSFILLAGLEIAESENREQLFKQIGRSTLQNARQKEKRDGY